jgi:cyanophycinase
MRALAIQKMLLLCWLFGSAATPVAADGTLLIVGGALSRCNAAVHEAFIAALPTADSRVAIVPAASGRPVNGADRFAETLTHYGVAADRIEMLPLAQTDDPDSASDESSWRDNGYQHALAEQIERFDGFWFLGGDQMRIIESLRRVADQDSPALAAMRRVLARGGVIGGTSAGAAMMSDPMIAGGDSFNALLLEPANYDERTAASDDGRLYLHHGLGFFPYGLVDQHFDRRARLGRLVRALIETGAGLGFAVDEDSAMRVDLGRGELTALGSATVTIIDVRGAESKRTPFAVRDARVTVLAPGDRFDLAAVRVISTEREASTIGREAAESPPHQGGGMALGNPRLAELLGFDLLDNAAALQLDRYSFIDSGAALRYRFRQLQDSRAYWRSPPGVRAQYTIVNVGLDIEPVQITLLETTRTPDSNR